MVSVIHDTQHSRFTTTVDGVLCVLDYHLRDGVMTITHTGVPGQVGGRGIAAELTRVALDSARPGMEGAATVLLRRRLHAPPS